MQTTKEFLETYICKAGESIAQISDNEWEIQKWTARTFKTLGNVFAVNQYDTKPVEAIIKLNLKPNARRQSLSLSESVKDEALHKGWIIQEVRFKKDGRTPLATNYRMGPGLFTYEKLKSEEAEKADWNLKQTLQKEMNLSKEILPMNFYENLQQFTVETADHESWSKERVRKFTHFLIAYLQLRRQQPRIEYKEIGATYYRRIGGSKVFDNYREVFIGRLEKWLGAPIQELGIISVGSIVPIYFTGQLVGRFAQYGIGTVHSTTDIAVTEEDFQTIAHVLWLVENRAVLTRMATEIEFLEETKSLVLGVDGQIRGAHRKLIQQLCQQGAIHKVMIWTDYDKAGEIIARDLVSLVDHLPYRLIGNEENVFATYETYINWSSTVSHAEQEMTLGGQEQWRKWIHQ